MKNQQVNSTPKAPENCGKMQERPRARLVLIIFVEDDGDLSTRDLLRGSAVGLRFRVWGEEVKLPRLNPKP